MFGSFLLDLWLFLKYKHLFYFSACLVFFFRERTQHYKILSITKAQVLMTSVAKVN